MVAADALTARLSPIVDMAFADLDREVAQHQHRAGVH